MEKKELYLKSFADYTRSIKGAISAYEKFTVKRNNLLGALGVMMSLLVYEQGCQPSHAILPLGTALLINVRPMFEVLKFHFNQKKQEKIFRNVLLLAENGHGAKVESFINNFLNWGIKNLPEQRKGLLQTKKKNYEILMQWLNANKINNLLGLTELLEKEFNKLPKMSTFK